MDDIHVCSLLIIILEQNVSSHLSCFCHYWCAKNIFIACTLRTWSPAEIKHFNKVGGWRCPKREAMVDILARYGPRCPELVDRDKIPNCRGSKVDAMAAINTSGISNNTWSYFSFVMGSWDCICLSEDSFTLQHIITTKRGKISNCLVAFGSPVSASPRACRGRLEGRRGLQSANAWWFPGRFRIGPPRIPSWRSL